MLEENVTIDEIDEVEDGVEPVADGAADVSAAAPLTADVESAAETEDEAAGEDSVDEPVADAEFDDDLDIDFDDPEMDLGPSLAEQLAAISVPELEDEAGEATEESGSSPDDRAWFVIHCYSGYENKVRHNLEQRIETMSMQGMIHDVVVPTEEEIEIKDGKRKPIERRVFPGYILVQLTLTEESWYVVRNTPGVTGFVGMGNTPTALSEQEVSEIMRRMEAEAPTIRVSFKPGQKVRITDGPFNDFIGTVANLDMDRGKVRVMVSFFGRETPVELDFLQVEKT